MRIEDRDEARELVASAHRALRGSTLVTSGAEAVNPDRLSQALRPLREAVRMIERGMSDHQRHRVRTRSPALR